MRLRNLLVAVGLLAKAFEVQAIDVGEPVMDVTIKNYKDGELSPKTLAGKVTVINFWATWCEACKVELVEMEEQFKPLLATKDKGFQAAFVTLDKQPEKAADWFRQNLKNPDALMSSLYVDPEFEAAGTLAVDSFPMTLVVGKDGKVVHVQKGFKEGEGSTEKIVEIAKSLLEK